MDRIGAVNQLLYEYDTLSEDMIQKLIADLPRKLVRWLGMVHPDNRTRVIFFRATGVQIGEGCVLNPNILIQDGYKGLVCLGKRVSVAASVLLIAEAGPNNSELQHLPYVKKNLMVSKAVCIEDDAWLGAGAIILPGITVGQGAIVGAGAVVTSDVPSRVVTAGVPARELRRL